MNKDFWERINKLEELAGKATPNEWTLTGYGVVEPLDGEVTICSETTVDNGEYIAAANSAMTLEIVTELRRLEKEADWLAQALVDRGHILGCVMDNNLHKKWRKAAQEAVKKDV